MSSPLRRINDPDYMALREAHDRARKRVRPTRVALLALLESFPWLLDEAAERLVDIYPNSDDAQHAQDYLNARAQEVAAWALRSAWIDNHPEHR